MAIVIAVLIFLSLGFVIINITRTKKSKRGNGKNPDVTKAVENPELVELLKKQKNQSEVKPEELNFLLCNSRFLSIIDTSELSTEKVQDNEYVAKKDSVIKIQNYLDENGNCLLPLFTDWKSINDFTYQEVSGLILPSKDAFDFVNMQKNRYKGIVINPFSLDYVLNSEEINVLLDLINSNACKSELMNIVVDEFSAMDGSVRIDDVLLLIGNLTGFFLFLSFNFDSEKLNLQPGSVLLSDETDVKANIVINNIFYSLIKDFGFDAEKIKPETFTYSGKLNYIERTGDVQDKALAVIKKYNFDYSKACELCEYVAAALLNSYCHDISINKAFGIVISGIIEGSKTVPKL